MKTGDAVVILYSDFNRLSRFLNGIFKENNRKNIASHASQTNRDFGFWGGQ